MPNNQVETENLKDQVTHLESEARMILPGLQALFGFELIAVFNQTFKTDLTPADQKLHLVSILTTVFAIGLAIAPASFRRQVESTFVSQRFVHLANCLLTTAIVFLMVGLVIEAYLLTSLILHDRQVATVASVAVFCALFILWFGYPWWQRLRD